MLTQRPYILPHIVRALIAAQRYQEAVDELNNVIASYPYRHNPQLHTYLGLLTLYLGAGAEAPEEGSPWAAAVPVLGVSPSVRRAAQMHLENAVKVARRYTTLQNYAFQHRMRMHVQRTERLRGRARAHRTRLWRQLRDDGWIFGEDAPVPADATTPAPPAPDELLPEASYFTLESEIESEYLSDGSPPWAPSGPVEGPAMPPNSATRATTPDLDDATIPILPPLDADAPTLCLPSIQWAVHVAEVYLHALARRTERRPPARHSHVTQR